MSIIKKTEDSAFSRGVLWVFNHLFCIIFLGLLLSLCFFNNASYKYNAFVTLLIALFIIGAGIFIYFHARKWSILRTRPYIVLAVSMGIVFLFQMIYVYLTTTNIGWDVGLVVGSAMTADPSEHNLYFSHYTNNLFLAFVFRIIAKLYFIIYGNHNNIWHALSVLNVIAIDFSIIILFLIGKKVFHLKLAYAAYAFSLLLFGFFPWIIVPYSDTLAMPFTVLLLWLVLLLKDASKIGYKVLLSILIGSVAFIGYLVKPTVIIILIAALLILLISTVCKWKRLGIHISCFLIIFAIFAIGNNLWKNYIYQQQDIYSLNEDIQVPLTHFFMMGMREMVMGTAENHTIFYGAYNEEDVIATFACESTEEMTEMHLRVIKERLQEYGPFGYLKFLINKARWITSEGQFFWGLEGNFANYDNQSNFLSNTIYVLKPYYTVYSHFSQGVWVAIIFLITYPLFVKKKDEKQYYSLAISLIRCAIFGILMFILLFEGRSRYLILYLPYFALLASYGASLLGDKFCTIRKNA